MQPPDQQPPVEAAQPVANMPEEQDIQPLYEYPSAETVLSQDIPQPAPATGVLPEAAPANMPLDEAVRRGLVYPPPPAYYQNMALSPEQPPLPLPQPTNAIHAPLPTYQYGSQHNVMQRPIPPGAEPYPYAYPVAPTPARRSRKLVWIVVSIFSAILLLSCGLCSWGAYSIFSSAYQQVSGSMNVVNDFYSNLQAQRYTQAYNDLAPQGSISDLTMSQFTQQAQTLDSQDGAIVSYTPNQPTLSTAPGQTPDLSHFTITVSIQRAKLSYTSLLTLQDVAGDWKIVDFDRL